MPVTEHKFAVEDKVKTKDDWPYGSFRGTVSSIQINYNAIWYNVVVEVEEGDGVLPNEIDFREYKVPEWALSKTS